MTRDEIIKLAREAGFAINTRTGDINASHGSYNWIISRELERFAALVAAAEREACAQVCEQRAGTVSMFPTSRDAKLHNQAVTGDASAIRARNKE